jgi:WhiB family redox-sensing transcriptional regulator
MSAHCTDDLFAELMGVLGRPSWMDAGACRGTGNAVFYPSRGGADDVAAAKSVCARCPVRIACLEYALVSRQRDGIWGGTAEKDRRVMLRAWRRGEPAIVAPLPRPEPTTLLRRPRRRRPFGCGRGCEHCHAVVVAATGEAPVALQPRRAS